MKGFCNYCGAVYEDLRWQTEEEANAAATQLCSCTEAVEAETVERCREYLKARFPLLAELGPEMLLLLRCMGGVALDHAAACTVQLMDGRKVKFSRGKEAGVVRVRVSKQNSMQEDVRANKAGQN